MVVVRARGARGRFSLIAELRSHCLQSAGRQSVGCRQGLSSGLGGFNRSDENPRRTVGVGRVVKVQRVGRVAAPGPDCRADGCRGRVRQRPAGGCDYDAVVGLIGMECSAGSIGAGVGDGVRLIRFSAARHVVASQKQRRTGVTGTADGGTFRSLQRGAIHRSLRPGR